MSKAKVKGGRGSRLGMQICLSLRDMQLLVYKNIREGFQCASFTAYEEYRKQTIRRRRQKLRKLRCFRDAGSIVLIIFRVHCT